MSYSFVIGKGTKVFIALLPEGDETTPKDTTLTIGNAAIPKDVTGDDATIALNTALPAGTLIVAGNYVSFKSPTTGKEVSVQLKEDAVAGDQELTVFSIPEEIGANSVAKFPLRLRGRTEANLDRTASRQATVDFDSDGYSKGAAVSFEQKLAIPGNWLPGDAGYQTAEYAATNLRQVYMFLELPKISAAYSKGRVYHGPTSITSVPLGIKADGVITGNIEVFFEGKPNLNPDTPVA